MKGLQAYVLSRNFTSDTADSLGSLKGAPCQIESIVYDEQAGTVTITFSWTGTSGKVQTDTAIIHDGKDGLDGKDGQDGAKGDKGDKGDNGTSITSIDSEGNILIIELSDGTSTEVSIPTVGVDNLAELADIDLGELSDGQVLVWDATTGKWTNGDGSGDSVLSQPVTSNLAVGAIPSGTTLPKGTTFTEFAQKLLISEIAPTTTFSASGSGTKEVGESVTPTLSLTITGKGTGTPTAIKFYNGSTLLNTQNYVDGTNSYTYTMESAITTTTTVKGVIEYKKSDESNASVEKTATYTFVMASYYGAVSVAPTDKAGITALTKNVKTSKGQTATFTLNNQRSCYAYPASMGNLSSIKDSNGFEYISGYTKTTVSVDSVDYNVYTQTDPVTASGFKQIYS